jgi:hypothetical protein
MYIILLTKSLTIYYALTMVKKLPVSFASIDLQDGKSKISVLLVLTLGLNLFLGLLAFPAQAVEMSEGYIRLDRLKAATATGGTVCMKPSATHTAALDAVEVTWPTGFTVNTTGGNWVGAGSTLGGATAMPGIAAATATVDTQTVTWTFAAAQTVTGGTMYCFTFGASSTLTNASAGNDKTGVMELTDATPASSETTVYALSIVAEDQVTVDADVPATFTFTVPDTAMDHGTLSTGSVDTDAQSSGMAVYTNAENGWIAWMKADSTNGFGLYSTSAADTIGDRVADGDTLATAGAGTEDWLVSVSLGASGTVVTEFDGNETTTGGRLPADGTFEQIASHTTVSDDDTITLTSIAAIGSTNKAASDYQETLTVVAAGNF